MRQKLFVSLVLALCLSLMVSAAFAVNFIVNSGFETPGPGTGNGDAPPWSYWAGTGGAVANPFVDANNSSARVWSNFGNPEYTNVAAQNELSNLWLIPGSTYHVHGQFYVPSSEIQPGITAKANIRFSMIVPPGITVMATNDPAGALTPDQWTTLDFDWVCPTGYTDSTSGATVTYDGPIQCNYMPWAILGWNGSVRTLNPGGYFDNLEFSSDAYTGVISGVVKTSAGPLEGASITLTYKGAAIKTITTAADGAFGFDTLIPGQSYSVNVTKSTYLGQTASCVASANLGDIVLVADPNYDPDVLFSVKSSSFTAAAGQATGDWAAALPAGKSLAAIATPVVAEINGQKWELNSRVDGDGFRLAGPGANGVYDQAIPVNGASVVAAVRPIRNSSADGWNSVVDIFYNRLVLVVRNSDGMIGVWRNGTLAWSTTAIPNGQITVLSLVVQPDGTYKVWANGTQAMDITDTSSMTSLDPLWNGGTGFWSYINVGRNNPDGWTTFSGNIGDVYVYKTAIDDAKRGALESEMTAKFGTSPLYKITASAGAGGAVSPSGVVEVPMSTSQAFQITPQKYFDVTDVKVDNASITLTSPDPQTYTFSNVVADHSIAVSFTEWAMANITGKVVLADNTPVEGITVTVSGGREPYTAVTAADGTYSIRVKPGVSYTVKAFKRGYAMSPASLPAGPGDLSGKNFTATFVGKQKLIDIKVDDSWADGDSVTSWTNNGILGGNFVSDGSKETAAATVAANYAGQKAVVFSNSKLLLSNDATTADASLVRAPESITGNGAYTVLAEICSTATLPFEQYYFAFAKTGGDANCAAFGFGTSGGYGAVAHWGGTDMGWNTPEADGGPDVNVWHKIAITFDGTVEKIYKNFDLVNSETKTLALYPNDPFSLGSRYDGDNAANRGVPFTGAIKSLQVFDAALTAGEIGNEFGLVILSGKVTLEDGVTPVAGVNVLAQGWDPNGVWEGANRTATTGADGTYSIPVETDMMWLVMAVKPNFITMTGEFQDVISADTVYDIKMKMTNAISGTVKDASGQPVRNAVVQVGQDGPVSLTGDDGKYMINDITAAPGVSFYADALGYGAYTESVDTSAAADGMMTKDVTLTAKNEIGVIKNGGFEQVTNGIPDYWTVMDGTLGAMSVVADGVSGNACKFAPSAEWEGVHQIIPVIPGSTYTFFMNAKADPTVTEWFPMFCFRAANGDELGGYVSAEPSYAGWVHKPSQSWMRYLLWNTYANSLAPVPAVRVTPPADATYLEVQFIVTQAAPWNGPSVYLDDVVVDRQGPDPAPVAIEASAGANGTISPAGTVSVNWGADQTFTITPNSGYAVEDVLVDAKSVGAVTSYTFNTTSANHTISATFKQAVVVKPYGANNKSILNDAKLVGKAVRVWGKITSKGASSYVIDDGYGAGVTIVGTTTQSVGDMVVVTGTLQSDKTVKP